MQFFASLDHDSIDDKNSCNLVFLSARPHVYKDGSERHSYQLFDSLFRSGKMHVVPTLLPGKLKQGLYATFLYPFIKTNAWKPVGELKVSERTSTTRLASYRLTLFLPIHFRTFFARSLGAVPNLHSVRRHVPRVLVRVLRRRRAGRFVGWGDDDESVNVKAVFIHRVIKVRERTSGND